MNKEDYNSYMKSLKDAEETPTTKEFPFDVISKKISLFDMCCKILDKHPDELEKSYKKEQQKRKFNPSIMLFDYFIVDIAMFYDCAKKRFNLDNNSMPETYGKVMRFRNNVMAHFGDKINTNVELVKEYILINDVDMKGFERIWSDYISFRDKIFERLKE
jgi:hypothetical protein